MKTNKLPAFLYVDFSHINNFKLSKDSSISLIISDQYDNKLILKYK